MNKALQVIGGLALLGWTTLGGVAWLSVKDGVDVTIQESGGTHEAELADLGGRIELLSEDLDVLIGSLEENFGLLATTLGDEASVVAADRARTAERLRQLEAALPAALEAREAAGALSSVLARLESIDLGRERPSPELSTPTGESPRVEPARPIPVTVAVPAPLAPASIPGPAKPARSFLAFKLPSRDFQFEGLQNFELLRDASRVGFDAKSTLHDFTGATTAVSGAATTSAAVSPTRSTWTPARWSQRAVVAS